MTEYKAAEAAFERAYPKPDTTCVCYQDSFDQYFCKLCDWRRRRDEYTQYQMHAANVKRDHIRESFVNSLTDVQLNELRGAAEAFRGSLRGEFLTQLHAGLSVLMTTKEGVAE